MSKTKKIWDYFTEEVSGCPSLLNEVLPYGTLFTYVASTFLNGFINYVHPHCIIQIDRYFPNDGIIKYGLLRLRKEQLRENHKRRMGRDTYQA